MSCAGPPSRSSAKVVAKVRRLMVPPAAAASAARRRKRSRRASEAAAASCEESRRRSSVSCSRGRSEGWSAATVAACSTQSRSAAEGSVISMRSGRRFRTCADRLGSARKGSTCAALRRSATRSRSRWSRSGWVPSSSCASRLPVMASAVASETKRSSSAVRSLSRFCTGVAVRSSSLVSPASAATDWCRRVSGLRSSWASSQIQSGRSGSVLCSSAS